MTRIGAALMRQGYTARAAGENPRSEIGDRAALVGLVGQMAEGRVVGRDLHLVRHQAHGLAHPAAVGPLARLGAMAGEQKLDAGVERHPVAHLAPTAAAIAPTLANRPSRLLSGGGG